MYDAEVLEASAEYSRVHLDDMLSGNRHAPVVKARRVAAVSLRILGYSYPEIGSMLGRDHTTVMNLVNRAGDDMWEAAAEIVERARERTFVLRYQPQMTFADALQWQVINPRTGTTVSLPPGLCEDLSAALTAGGMEE